mgnify:CR=1 FL=1
MTSYEIRKTFLDFFASKGHTIVASSPNTVIEAKIILHERVDVEMRLRFEYAGVRVSARVDLRTKNRTGDVVKFAFSENKIHLFDKETEEAIGGKFNY